MEILAWQVLKAQVLISGFLLFCYMLQSRMICFTLECFYYCKLQVPPLSTMLYNLFVPNKFSVVRLQ